MDIWEVLLIAMLISVIAPIIFSIFWFFKVRGEKKILGQEVIRTHPPKTLSGFFLGFALLVLFGGIAGIIYCCITDSENTTATGIILISMGIAALSSFGFFGFAFACYNFVIVDAEGIHVCRLFRKKRFYRFDEIGCFQDTSNLVMLGGIIGYDKAGTKIFSIEAVHIGASAVVQRLCEHGVQEKFKSKLNLY